MPDAIIPPERGVFERALVWLFGASWATSLSGYVTIAAYYIHQHPEWLHWIPEPLQNIVWTGSEYVFIGAFGTLAWRAKDKALTGGNKQQSYSGGLVDVGKQDLVDATVVASVKSGEKIPEEVKASVTEVKP